MTVRLATFCVVMMILLPAALAWAGEPQARAVRRPTAPTRSEARDSDMHNLTNQSLSATVDPQTGRIVSLVDRALNRDYCQPGNNRFGMIGGLRVKDMASGQEYDDFVTPSQCQLVEWRHAEAGDRLILDKQFEGADFVLRLDFRMAPDALQWDVYARKTAGPDRQIRLTYLLPLASLNLWAPMSDPIVRLRWEEPFQVRHGLSYGRAVQPQHRTALIPMVTLFDHDRCLAYSMPPDVPNVCVRFMNSADEDSLFLLNSITNYPIDQRPHFKVVHDFLSLREGKETRYSLLISAHESKWRDALGWYANRYSAWFQPDPKIRSQEGVYAISSPFDRDSDESLAEPRMAGRAERGVGWMELHGHFPWYGLYVHPTDTWAGHHESGPMSYDKVRRYIDLARKHGIALHIYYNIIDGQIPYVSKEFPESVVRDDDGQIVPAFHDCYLMNADLSLPFGRHCLEQFHKLLETYPNIDGIFFDVYGRHYNIDFGHDDGLTMVNNRPAYCIKFAFQRLMDKIDPVMRQKGLVFSANKPEGIELMRGIDYIMADEGADEDRLEAMQYYGLYKPIIILDGGIWTRPESDFKACLRLGMIYNDIDPQREGRRGGEVTDEMRERTCRALEAYEHLFKFLIGKTWVLAGEPLELPSYVRGNIFRRLNNDYVVTMVSDDRSVFDDLPPRKNVKVIVRVPDADKIGEAEVWSADYKGAKPATIDRGDKAAAGPDTEKWKEEEAVVSGSAGQKLERQGNTLVVTVPEHKSASVVVLKRTEG